MGKSIKAIAYNRNLAQILLDIDVYGDRNMDASLRDWRLLVAEVWPLCTNKKPCASIKLAQFLN